MRAPSADPLLLMQRWGELVRALDVAQRAAERIGNSSGLAWAQHELGTLNLAAGDETCAESCLARAHKIREELHERQGLAATQQNLSVLCRRLRDLLHEPVDETVIAPAGRGLLALLIAAVVPLVLAAARTRSSCLPYRRLSATRRGLTVEVTGHGLVTSASDGLQCRHACRRDVRASAAVSLTARADKGWRFKGWSNACSGKNLRAPAIGGSATVTATFSRKLPECRDRRDNDHDRFVDRRDPGCANGTEAPVNPAARMPRP